MFLSAKEALLKHDICTNTPLGLAFAASTVSGVMVAIIVCPFDVTTVRLYNQGKYIRLEHKQSDSIPIINSLLS